MVVPRRRRSVLSVLLTISFAAAAGAIGLFLLSLTAERPTNLGVNQGRLAACPSSPNCVSTQAEDRDHWIAPIAVTSDTFPPIEVLADIVRSMPRTIIVEQSNHYLRVEFRSQLFRFCDDVEFYLEEESDRIHLRSASRVGHSDMGVNRNRMELIRERYIEATRSSVQSVPDPGRRALRKTQILSYSR